MVPDLLRRRIDHGNKTPTRRSVMILDAFRNKVMMHPRRIAAMARQRRLPLPPPTCNKEPEHTLLP
jgi:hypothetical protein